jgi:hypothetical protein
MLALGFDVFGSLWTTWVPLGAGVLVTSLVIGSGVIYRRWRGRWQRLTDASREEDLPWQELLSVLQKRNRDRAAAGLPVEQATEELLSELVASLPAVPSPRPVELPEDREFVPVGGNERRAWHRRWGNPTEIHLFSLLWPGHLHGLVVNRSTGGLGIFTDRKVPPGTPLHVRAAEAPSYVPMVQAEARHCRRVGPGFLIGCEFSEDVPWNARVWFG